MKPVLYCLGLLAVLALSACEPPDRYPVSGEQCGPEDPVLDLSVDDCTPPV
ncbi:hypothetical protein [uncultured Tateyamaria sp.]|uniref:hypothetical protein n=1 Tax=uncultured Tateyamaria sp. TaxID=455651 RepID=UPI00260F7687|nr:hypothetical protein [uncultured Tateyamaria sp.]